jgi:hypothetical protein
MCSKLFVWFRLNSDFWAGFDLGQNGGHDDTVMFDMALIGGHDIAHILMVWLSELAWVPSKQDGELNYLGCRWTRPQVSACS